MTNRRSFLASLAAIAGVGATAKAVRADPWPFDFYFETYSGQKWKLRPSKNCSEITIRGVTIRRDKVITYGAAPLTKSRPLA